MVALVAQGLNYQGIRVWWDRENLRGGKHWNRIIDTLICKQVHYVVVMQSPRMQASERAVYVYKEIWPALKRARSFREPIRFIIPVKLAPCESPFSELAIYHHAELFDSQGVFDPQRVRDLASSIWDDWQLRLSFRGPA